MAGTLRNISQQRRLSVHVVYYGIQPPIAVQVADRQSARAPGLRQPTAGCCSQSLEFPILQILKQQHLLGITRAPLLAVNRRVNMAVGNQDILPTVVVEIYEVCAPTQERISLLTMSRLKSHICKIPVTVVVVENIRVI